MKSLSWEAVLNVRDRKGWWNGVVKSFGKTLTVDPYVCIDVAHREKTAPLGFCESIFLIKDAISLCQPACVQLVQVILLPDRGAARLWCPWTAPKSSQPAQTKAGQ